MNRMLPVFCSRMWMKQGDNGVVAALYAPSSFTTKVKGGKQDITVHEETNYPFDETVRFRFDTKRPTEFSLWLRIPQWCEGASVKVNGESANLLCKPGTYIELKRKFSAKDIVELQLPMKPQTVSMPYNGIAIQRGPLMFSYPVPANEKVFEPRDFEGIQFQSAYFTPNGKWNYAPIHTDRIKVTNSGNYNQPWKQETTPVKLTVDAVKVKNWQLYRKEFTPCLPPVIDKGEETQIELVPLGTTYLRVTVFPNVASIPE